MTAGRGQDMGDERFDELLGQHVKEEGERIAALDEAEDRELNETGEIQRLEWKYKCGPPPHVVRALVQAPLTPSGFPLQLRRSFGEH